MEELKLDHEPSMDHWAKLIADENAHHSNWDHEYKEAWHDLDAEYNYNYEYREDW